MVDIGTIKQHPISPPALHLPPSKKFLIIMARIGFILYLFMYLVIYQICSKNDEHEGAGGEVEEAEDGEDPHVTVWGGECHVQHNEGNPTILYRSFQRDCDYLHSS